MRAKKGSFPCYSHMHRAQATHIPIWYKPTAFCNKLLTHFIYLKKYIILSNMHCRFYIWNIDCRLRLNSLSSFFFYKMFFVYIVNELYFCMILFVRVNNLQIYKNAKKILGRFIGLLNVNIPCNRKTKLLFISLT